MRLLCHICCGPCAAGILTELSTEEELSVTGFWYNPNIHPWAEYQRRLMTAGYLARRLNAPLEEAAPDFPEFLAGMITAHREGRRCDFCRRRRLAETAATARRKGYRYFTSSLLASVHQDHRRLKELGTELAREYGVDFWYRDFRHPPRQTCEASRRWGLYHQNYCGCLYSEWERRGVIPAPPHPDKNRG